MSKLVGVFAGDGIGPEIMAQARRVLDALDLDLVYSARSAISIAIIWSGICARNRRYWGCARN